MWLGASLAGGALRAGAASTSGPLFEGELTRLETSKASFEQVIQPCCRSSRPRRVDPLVRV